MELEASEPPNNIIYMEEAGFNLTKCRATVDLPGQQGVNMTVGAAISVIGVLRGGSRPFAA